MVVGLKSTIAGQSPNIESTDYTSEEELDEEFEFTSGFKSGKNKNQSWFSFNQKHDQQLHYQDKYESDSVDLLSEDERAPLQDQKSHAKSLNQASKQQNERVIQQTQNLHQSFPDAHVTQIIRSEEILANISESESETESSKFQAKIKKDVRRQPHGGFVLPFYFQDSIKKTAAAQDKKQSTEEKSLSAPGPLKVLIWFFFFVILSFFALSVAFISQQQTQQLQKMMSPNSLGQGFLQNAENLSADSKNSLRYSNSLIVSNKLQRLSSNQDKEE